MPPVTCPACGRPLADAAAPCPQCQHAPAPATPPDAAASPASVHAAWQQARAAFARADYAAAVAACAQVLELAPAHEEAARLKAQAEQKQQAKDAALQLASGYFNKGQYELALAHFSAALVLAPADENIRRKQEMARLLAGQDLTAYTPTPIRRMTSKWTDEAVPSPVSTMVMAGVIAAGAIYLSYYAYARTQKHRLAAEQLYRQVEQRLVVKKYLSGPVQESYHQLTTVYGNTSFAKDAAEMLANIKAKKLEEAPRQLDQAEALLEANDPAQALELTRDVLYWDPENDRARAVIARAKEAVRQLEERDRQQAVNRGARHPVATAAGATAPAATITALPDLLEQQDDHLSPDVKKLVMRGQDRLNASDYAAAAFLWEQALARHGRPHQILQCLVGSMHLLDERERHRFEEGRARAAALEKARQWPEALSAYREAQTHRPADADVAQKIVLLQGRLALTPESSAAPSATAQQATRQRWRSEASYYEQNGQWREAAKAYRKALAGAPDPALRDHLHMSQLIDAEERRRAERPGTPDAGRDLVLAEAYLARGKPFQARQLLYVLLPSVPPECKGRQAVLQSLIGRAYADEHADTDAIVAYRRSVAQAPVWYVQHSLATALWRDGQFLEAMRVWEQVRQQAPQQIDVIASLASVYALVDLPAKAQELLQPLTGWNAGELRRTQRYPSTVRPEYWVGAVPPRALLAEMCDHVAQAWALLDQPRESFRWRQLAQAERDDQAQAERRALPAKRPWWQLWLR